MKLLENCGLRKNFYTVPSDHYNCAVGSHTHNIPLPPERAKELEQTLSFMTDIGYIKMEEVPGIPQLATMPGAVVYSPLGDAPVDPDVVIFAGPAAQIMLLQEAAHRAGRTAQFPMSGRPTCMAIPAAMAKGAITSSGYIGNRVYTDLADGELYAMVPEKIWSASRMSSRQSSPPTRSFMSIIAPAARKFRPSRSGVQSKAVLENHQERGVRWNASIFIRS